MNETTCDTNDDCSNAYLWCNGNGVCGCQYIQGAALDEDGMCPWTSTWMAKTHFALTCTVFIGSMLVLAYHTYATWRVVRLGAKGTIRTSPPSLWSWQRWAGRQYVRFTWCGSATRHSLALVQRRRPRL